MRIFGDWVADHVITEAKYDDNGKFKAPTPFASN